MSLVGRVGAASLALVAGLATASALAQTTVYRWVDREGRVHFTDQPPTEAHSNLTQRVVGGNFSADARASSADLQAVVQKFPVVLYTSAECGEPCRMAREMLLKRGIPFAERNAQSGPEVADELVKRAGGLYVPSLGVGSNTLRGYEASSWRTVLDTAGYPASATPPR